MIAEKLKKSILQAAIQGKLTKHEPGDGTAAELLQQIAAEKAKLIKEGKIKKEKPLPEISEEEKPFDLPEGWEWCRLGALTAKIGAGSTPNGGRRIYSQNGIKFIRSQNVYNDGLYMAGMAYISEEINNKHLGSAVHPMDILLNITGGSIGRCAIVSDDFDCGNVNQHVLIVRLVEKTLRQYIHLVLISPYIQYLIMNVQVGVSREGLSAEKTKNFIIPLPPLTEQQRIISCMEKFLSKTDSLLEDEKKLDALQSTMPERLKASLLQAAIQGKLTERLPGDGNAEDLLAEIAAEKQRLIKEKKIKKEKPLLEITEEEKSFDLPEGWAWCRLGEIFTIARGGSPRPIKQYLTTDAAGINWIKIGDSEIGGKYINSTNERIIYEGVKKSRYVHEGDLLLTNSMSYGRPYILNIKGCIHDGWLVLSPLSKSLCKEYFYYLLSSTLIRCQFQAVVSGAVVKNLNTDKVIQTIILLPPLAEQQRIVQRLEELLPLCEGILCDK